MASALVDVRDPGLDRPLLWTVALLALAGLVIVTSASLQIAETRLDSPFHYGLRLSLIHISEPTRLLSISYAVFCLKKKK